MIHWRQQIVKLFEFHHQYNSVLEQHHCEIMDSNANDLYDPEEPEYVPSSLSWADQSIERSESPVYGQTQPDSPTHIPPRSPITTNQPFTQIPNYAQPPPPNYPAPPPHAGYGYSQQPNQSYPPPVFKLLPFPQALPRAPNHGGGGGVNFTHPDRIQQVPSNTRRPDDSFAQHQHQHQQPNHPPYQHQHQQQSNQYQSYTPRYEQRDRRDGDFNRGREYNPNNSRGTYQRDDDRRGEYRPRYENREYQQRSTFHQRPLADPIVNQVQEQNVEVAQEEEVVEEKEPMYVNPGCFVYDLTEFGKQSLEVKVNPGCREYTFEPYKPRSTRPTTLQTRLSHVASTTNSTRTNGNLMNDDLRDGESPHQLHYSCNKCGNSWASRNMDLRRTQQCRKVVNRDTREQCGTRTWSIEALNVESRRIDQNRQINQVGFRPPRDAKSMFNPFAAPASMVQ